MGTHKKTRQTGQTYAANTSTNYISGATSLNDADIKLDTQLKAEQDEIDAIETAVGLASGGSYVANTANTYTNDATSVANAVDKLDAAVFANKVEAGNGIEVTTASTGTTVAVDLKADAGSGDNDWHNPLKFDTTDHSLYFDAIDCGTY